MQTLLSIALTSALLASPAAPSIDTAPELSVPFGCGQTFWVSQAHNTGSHLLNDVWAWDFRMPEGTPVVAAMDGVVRMARGDSTVGGCDPSYAPYANYVVVSHPGGMETQYLHFREVTVKPGDKVKAGDLLGYSGQTGWACGAHLHFKLARQKSSGWNNPSIPARIRGYGDPQVNTEIVAPACRNHEVQVAGASHSLQKPTPTRPEIRENPEARETARGAAVPATSNGPPLTPPARASAGPI